MADIPSDALTIIRRYRTCEFSTLAKDGTPIKVVDLARLSGSSSRQVTEVLYPGHLDKEVEFDIHTDTFRAHKQGDAL